MIQLIHMKRICYTDSVCDEAARLSSIICAAHAAGPATAQTNCNVPVGLGKYESEMHFSASQLATADRTTSRDKNLDRSSRVTLTNRVTRHDAHKHSALRGVQSVPNLHHNQWRSQNLTSTQAECVRSDGLID